MASELDVDITEVIQNLYIGPEKIGKNRYKLKDLGITHILTVNAAPLPESVIEDFVYKFVYALDLEFTDLLSHFDECVEFIGSGLKDGAVFVHCLVGVSRSAALVIAYLMKTKGLDYQAALELVRSKRYVCPNAGFEEQLILYGEMGCKLDLGNENYRRYRLHRLTTKMQQEGKSEFSPEDLNENPENAPKDGIVFRCKKCRQVLFRHSGFVTHSVGQGEAAFDWRGKSSSEMIERSEEVCDRSIFIEPVRWMADHINCPEGKLFCPKCNTKIGSFIWYGERCPCGSWVAPAFHIQSSKVDEIKPVVLPVRQILPT